MQFLFLPIFQDLEYFRQSLHRFKLLEIIFKSLRRNAEKRVTYQSWSIVSDIIKDFGVLFTYSNSFNEIQMLIGKIFPKDLERKGVVLDSLEKAVSNDSGFVMELSKVNQNEAWVMSNTHVSHVQKLPSIYFDKKFTLLSKSMILIHMVPLTTGMAHFWTTCFLSL